MALNQFWDGDRQVVPLDVGSPTSSFSSAFEAPYSQPAHTPPSISPESTTASNILRELELDSAQLPLDEWFPIPNNPSLIITPLVPSHDSPRSFDGLSEHLQQAEIPQQQMQVDCAPCPFLTFLEENKVMLNREQVQALEMVRGTGVSDALDSFVLIYYQAKAQQISCPAPASSPNGHSLTSRSTATGLPNHVRLYACPGLDRRHRATVNIVPYATEKKPGRFACPMCGHRSDRKNDILKHMTLRNSAIGYRCPHGSCGCQWTFTRKHRYVEHLKRHDGVSWDSASVRSAKVQLVQHYPKTCLHCSKPMRSWDHWYGHWLRTHNDQSGRDVLPLDSIDHWPASGVQQQISRPNLAVSGISTGPGSGLVDPNLDRWESCRDLLEGFNVLGGELSKARSSASDAAF